MNTRANAATTYKGIISRGYEQEIGAIGYPAFAAGCWFCNLSNAQHW
jgi:hypothetical protein